MDEIEIPPEYQERADVFSEEGAAALVAGPAGTKRAARLWSRDIVT